MNKKFLIGIIVVLGLSIGLFWSYQNNNSHSNMGHKNHQMSSETDHPNHGSHEEMNHAGMNDKMMGKMDLPVSLRKQLDKTVLAYFDIQKALSKDELDNAKKKSKEIELILMQKDINQLSGHTKTLWEKERRILSHSLMALKSSKNLTEARKYFEKLSMSIEMLVTHFGGPKGEPITKYHCPMVDNNRGAAWLQNSKGTQNPYYGSQMFSCGSKVKEL